MEERGITREHNQNPSDTWVVCPRSPCVFSTSVPTFSEPALGHAKSFPDATSHYAPSVPCLASLVLSCPGSIVVILVQR